MYRYIQTADVYFIAKAVKNVFINPEYRYKRLIILKYVPDGRQRVIVSRFNGTHKHTHNNTKTNLSSGRRPCEKSI